MPPPGPVSPTRQAPPSEHKAEVSVAIVDGVGVDCVTGAGSADVAGAGANVDAAEAAGDTTGAAVSWLIST